MLRLFGAACLALIPAYAPRGNTITVPAGGDLHTALINARPGDTIALERGATYVGNFTLPNKDGAEFITIRTAGPDDVPPGQRVAIDAAKSFAKLRSPNTQPALQTAPGAHHWRLALLDVAGAPSGPSEVLTLGSATSAQRTLADVPHDLAVDRCYIHGDAAAGTKRCVALKSASTTISDSYVSNSKQTGQEAQAIGGWNGPGPYTISNNYVEGAGENIMFGGADATIRDLVARDIHITGNLLSKPVAWRSEKWTVKNLLELKNARRVAID